MAWTRKQSTWFKYIWNQFKCILNGMSLKGEKNQSVCKVTWIILKSVGL